jgi:hypothetical protein
MEENIQIDPEIINSALLSLQMLTASLKLSIWLRIKKQILAEKDLGYSKLELEHLYTIKRRQNKRNYRQLSRVYLTCLSQL